MKTTKKIKGFHTPNSSTAKNDNYGTGVKNPLGIIKGLNNKKIKKVPRGLA